jgi:hypothetical protein
MPAMVLRVGLAVMVESVVLQADPRVSRVRMLTAVPAGKVVTLDSAVTAATGQKGWRTPDPAPVPVETAVTVALRVPVVWVEPRATVLVLRAPQV